MSQALAAGVLDSTPDCYLAVDSSWRLILLNKAAEEFTRLSRTEILGGNFWDVFPHVVGTHLEALYRAVMEQRTARDIAIQSTLRPDVYVRLRIFPFSDGVALRFRDVTPEHDIEEQHRRALAELEAVYKFAPIGLALIDSDLRYMKINDALAEMDGVAIEDHIGRTVAEVVPEASEQARQLFRTVFTTKAPVLGIELSGESSRAPGVKKTLLGNISPVLIEDTRVRAALVAVIEISDLKNTEEKLAKSLRLQKLLHRELVHRVANNFQLVSSMLHMQGRRSEIPGVAQALNDAADRIQSMGIIHRKLYANQPDLGAPELVSYLRELCADLTGVYAGVPDHPQLIFRGEGEIRLSFDRTLMVAMIVAELVTNAYKYAYAPGTRGEIVVSLERRATNEVMLSVADSGQGLPQDMDLARSRGLGMLVARSNARQLGTELEVDRMSPGVRFHMLLRTDE